MIGNVFPEGAFKHFVEQTLARLTLCGDIYIEGNRQSYIDNVRKLGMTSLQEARMGKTVASYKNAVKNKHIPCKTIFEDTEFPYDPDTGKYIV